MTKKSILLVDDNQINLDLLGDVLESDDRDIRFAISAEDALKAVEERCPDLILLDIQMPKIDGYETGRMIRALAPDRAAPRIVYVTATQNMLQVLANAFATRVMDYLFKPLDIMLTRSKVESVLEISADHFDQQHYDHAMKSHHWLMSMSTEACGFIHPKNMTLYAYNAAMASMLGLDLGSERAVDILDMLSAAGQTVSDAIKAATGTPTTVEASCRFNDPSQTHHWVVIGNYHEVMIFLDDKGLYPTK